MKENLTSMAERLGISVSTVSRVLSGNAEKYRISPETAEKVKAEARRCNYSPSLVAQSLRRQKTRTVGLLLPALTNPYFAEMAGTVITECRRRGYTTIVIDTMEDTATFNDGVAQLVSRQVDGILAAPCGQDPEFLEKVDIDIVPVVLIDRYYENSALPFVSTNNFKGGYDATRFLLSHGHRNIACIQGTPLSTPNNERVRGYLDAMDEERCGEFISVTGNEFSIQNGYTEARIMLAGENPPSAIFSLSNTITLGVLKALREAKLRIPGDISLVSFDNYSYMDYMDPPLTRIGQPVEDMATLAVKILFERMDSRGQASSQLKLSPSVISGESVGFVKPGRQAGA